MGISSVTRELLSAYYPVVENLQQYLFQIIEHTPLPAELYLTHETDTIAYRKLLRESCITTHTQYPNATFKAPVPPMVSLRELIERAQEKLLRKHKGSTISVITAGYRLNYSRQGQQQKAILNTFLNTMVTAIQGPEWQELFQRIGEDAMFHLLTETSIFVSLPNRCYCQMTGEPIVNLKPPGDGFIRPISRPKPDAAPIQNDTAQRCQGLKRKATEFLDERPAKRLRRTTCLTSASSGDLDRVNSSNSAFTEKRTPADIAFIRARMLYYRPYFMSRAKMILLGFPPKHVLNRLQPPMHSNQGKADDKDVTPDSSDRMDKARHLAKYVFPRQYGLPNPFTGNKQNGSGNSYPDYSDREGQIKKLGSVKTPKRLKEILGMLEKLLWRHGKCGHKALLNAVCPSKLKMEADRPLESSVILEIMSEHSIVLCSQSVQPSGEFSVDSDGHTILPEGLSELRAEARNKPRFAEFMCSHDEVFRYALAITNAVIPFEFWGNETNFKLIIQHIRTLISARRFETLTLHHVLQGFSISACDWLCPGGKATTQTRVSVSDSLKRRELLEEFLFWFFDSFLIPLLRTTFYITESSAFRNRILYFRQDDWSTLCAPLVERLSENTFERLEPHEAQELLRQHKLGFSFVRLLPKETGVRPVVNLRRKKIPAAPVPGTFRAEQSINQILQAAFQILNYEKETQLARMGSSVFGPNQVYTKLKAFQKTLRERSSSGVLPKLYFVKVDVQACFDTIEQGKLLSILHDLLSEDTYLLQRYGVVTVAANKIKRAYVKKAVPADDHPHFLSFATKLAGLLRNSILVDQVVYPYAHKQEILALLEEHITENLVKIGNDYYRQTVGIPQGSVLSAILCSFFYGDLERTQLKFTEDPQSVLLRLIDDYLFITTSPGRARKFLAVMREGHPEYGCFISQDKTLTNFETDDPLRFIGPEEKVFPWCGYMINMTDLSVSVDYGRYHETYLQDSLTVERGRRPGIVFTQKMMQLAKSKSHIIYNDSTFNTRRVILKNIYENFMLCAMKMHYYIHSSKLTVSSNWKFLSDVIRQLIRYTHSAMRSKEKGHVAKTAGGKCDVDKAQVVWLGTHAFHTVLSQKAHTYGPILASLEKELNSSHSRRVQLGLKKVAKDCKRLMVVLSFAGSPQ